MFGDSVALSEIPLSGGGRRRQQRHFHTFELNLYKKYISDVSSHINITAFKSPTPLDICRENLQHVFALSKNKGTQFKSKKVNIQKRSKLN